ncbi:MAG: cyclic nucleotide-binding domain-containing protein [Thermodesulfobacteriota bacterium]
MIFGKLDVTEKTHLALSLNNIHLNAGDYLIRKGETEDCGYVLAHGALEIPGTEIIFTPPAIVGEFTAAGFTERRTADIKATEDFTSVYRITSNDLQRLMESNPDIEMQLRELARARGLKV